MNLKLVIITPVYNDWESFVELVKKIDQNISPQYQTSILVVDDCSSLPCEKNMLTGLKLSRLQKIEVIQLSNNMGHQRAIAVGLSNIFTEYSLGDLNIDAVVVMDSDGEDCPEDLNCLINEYTKYPNKITVAKRTKRSEGPIFSIFYLIYKFIFRLLTGKIINFGNFIVLPANLLSKIVFLPATWNNFPAAIMKSKIPIKGVPTMRGSRYAGKSKMNFISLVTHGLSAVSVFIEEALIRILLVSLIVSTFSIIGIFIVILIRFFTDLAIPGWATYAVGIFTVVFLQTIMLLVFAVFNILNNRSNLLVVPVLQTKHFILGRITLYKK